MANTITYDYAVKIDGVIYPANTPILVPDEEEETSEEKETDEQAKTPVPDEVEETKAVKNANKRTGAKAKAKSAK